MRGRRDRPALRCGQRPNERQINDSEGAPARRVRCVARRRPEWPPPNAASCSSTTALPLHAHAQRLRRRKRRANTPNAPHMHALLLALAMAPNSQAGPRMREQGRLHSAKARPDALAAHANNPNADMALAVRMLRRTTSLSEVECPLEVAACRCHVIIRLLQSCCPMLKRKGVQAPLD